MRKYLKMHLQKFAADPVDDDPLFGDGDPLDDGLDDDPPVVVVSQNPPPPAQDPLAGAAWGNVVTLMETQNALLEKNLSGMTSTLEQLREAATSARTASDRVAAALEKLEEAQTANPDSLDPGTSIESPATEPERKKGPRWRK